MIRFSKYLHNLLSTISLLSLLSCSQSDIDRSTHQLMKDPIDREINLSRNEIKDSLRPSSEDKEKQRTYEKNINPNASLNNELEFAPIVVSPQSPDIKSNKRVSLSVTESVDVKDVLLELSRLSELELALDPNIKGGIILNVSNRPVNEVLEMISDMADLRYVVDNGVLKVMRDNPHLINYNVDFLNLIRSSNGTINTQTQVLSAVSASGSSGGSGGGGSNGGGAGGSGGGNEAFNSGSTNRITTSYDGDLWKSLENNLVSILGSNLADLKVVNNDKNSAPSTLELLANKNVKSNSANNDSAVTPSAAESIISANENDPRARSSALAKANAANTYYSINKQAGIISVMATERKQKSIRQYLDKVKASMSAQVLIEAKVVEVALNEEYATGIDWSRIRAGFNTTTNGNFSFAPTLSNVFTEGPVFSGVVANSNFQYTRSKNNNELSALLKMIEGFGISRTLSNPRITVLNNQQAVLTFAKNQTYYTVSGTLQQNATNTANNTTVNLPISISSTLHTIPIGVILSLQPSIDIERQEVTMHVRPTLSTQVGDGILDPAVELLRQSISSSTGNNTPSAAIDSKVPIVQVRELDTVLKAKSGDVMIIGGLIQHLDASSDEGVPFISRIPILGNAAKRVEKQTNVVETVILIQATILSPKGHYHPHDKKIYETFTQDPRPLVFN